MEIRMLGEQEIPAAVRTAREVFAECVRPLIREWCEEEWFLGYVCEDGLRAESGAGQLFLWGAFDGGEMAAVAAMRLSCQITMLYVRPAYQRRGIGERLVGEMCDYAADALGAGTVTVNAAPISAAGYFFRFGFTGRGEPAPGALYAPLQRAARWTRQGNASQGATYGGGMAQGNAAPQGTPQGNASQGATYGGGMAQGNAAPQGTPQGSAPQGAAFGGGMAQGSAPQGEAPNRDGGAPFEGNPYPRRRVKTGVIAALAAISFGGSFLLIAWATLHYLAVL